MIEDVARKARRCRPKSAIRRRTPPEIDRLRAETAQMRAVLEKIAARRPVTDRAGEAFYRSRQDAKNALRVLGPRSDSKRF